MRLQSLGGGGGGIKRALKTFCVQKPNVYQCLLSQRNNLKRKEPWKDKKKSSLIPFAGKLFQGAEIFGLPSMCLIFLQQLYSPQCACLPLDWQGRGRYCCCCWCCGGEGSPRRGPGWTQGSQRPRGRQSFRCCWASHRRSLRGREKQRIIDSFSFGVVFLHRMTAQSH